MMFDSEEIRTKEVQTEDGQREFQLRWIGEEAVGVLTDRSERHWFLLDSGELWYDVTQDRSPIKQRCRCKNDWFTVTLDFLTRKGTADFREATPRLRCTECGREKRITAMELDYAPTMQLFEQPIAPCPAPRIKYRTYNRAGFWSKEQMKVIGDFFASRGLLPYRWHLDRETMTASILPIAPEVSAPILTGGSIFFSRTPMDPGNARHSLWRRGELFELCGPVPVIGAEVKNCYWFEFSAEYLDKNGNITPKSPEFCRIVKDFLALLKKLPK